MRMRQLLMVASIALLAAPAAASPPCPEGTFPFLAEAGEHTHEWCAFLTQDGKSGVKHGPYLTFGPGGELLLEGEFVNGKRNGSWEAWNPDGSPSGTTQWEEGVQQGPATQWRDGALLARGSHHAGKRTGLWTFYYPNGQIRLEERYTDGELDGSFRAYFEDGTLAEEGSYDSGAESGEWTQYHANGRVEARGPARDGRRSGPWQRFDDQGAALSAPLTSQNRRAVRREFVAGPKPAVVILGTDPQD